MELTQHEKLIWNGDWVHNPNPTPENPGCNTIAQYCVGFGGQGSFYNRKFATLAEAEQLFEEIKAGLIATYSKNKNGYKAVYQEDVKDYTKYFACVNLKKDGTKGKQVQKVHIKRINQE